MEAMDELEALELIQGVDELGAPMHFEVVGWDELEPREFVKAGEPAPAGERWITVHGAPGAKGVPVLIRPVPGSKGTFHVTGGAGGKLNGLKINSVKSPEEYREQSKVKAKEARAKQKAELDAMTPEERAKFKEGTAAQKEQRAQAEQAFSNTVLGEAKMPELPEGTSKEEAAKAQKLFHRERLKLAFQEAAKAEKTVLADAEVRQASGLDLSQPKDSGVPGVLNIDDIVTQKGLAKGPGYQRPLAAMAEQSGLTAESLAQQAFDIRTRAAQEAGKPLPDPKTPPGSEIAAQGAEVAPENQGLQQQMKTLRAQQAAAMRKAISESIDANPKLAEVLRARAALRQSYQEAVTASTGRIFEPGFQMRTSNPDMAGVVDKLEQTYLHGAVSAFLDEVEKDHPAEEFLNLNDAQAEDGLHATRGAAAFDALQEAGLAALGMGALNRDTVEVLGPEGAAQVLSRAIRQAYTPEDQKQILAALEKHHLEEQQTELPNATASAQGLREQALAIQLDVAGSAKDLAVAAEMTRNKLDILKEARRILGGTLGRLEARAALIASLQGAPQDTLTVPMGKMTPERAVQTAAALGLKTGDYKIDHYQGEATLTLGPKAQDSLIAPVDQTAMAEREVALSIKRGQCDTEGYLPLGFSSRTGSRFDNPLVEPPVLQTKLDIPAQASMQEVKDIVREHMGSRLAEGQSVASIVDDLTTGDTAQHLSPELAAQVKSVAQGAIAGPDGGTMGTTDAASKLVSDFMLKNGIPGDSTFHGQTVDPDSHDFREALHRTLAEDPRLRAAFIPSAELSSEHAKAIRDFHSSEMGRDGGDLADKKAIALDKLGVEPDKFHDGGTIGDDLGMDPVPTPEWQAWDQQRQAIEDAHGPDAAWHALASKGGLKAAQDAVKAKMASAFADTFQKHFQDVSGTKLRVGSMMDGRKGLGMALEGQIYGAMPDAAKPFEGMTKGVKLAKGLSMDGQFVNQQRGIKAAVQLKRIGLFYGAGSGKSAIMLGTATELHAKGQLKKTIMAVPSVVQAQFGAEAARFVDPTSGFHVHARPGETFEERLAAYKDPDKHAIVVTHQALRDDTLKLVGKHLGLDPEKTHDFIMSTPKPELAKAVKAAFDAEGINYNSLMVDEGHNALNRKGKQDSALARIIDAHGHSAEHYIGATGSPVKNDPSEAFDWLQKIDPQRYPEGKRDEFLRRYGVDSAMTRRSLKQELTRYFFADRVHPGISANHQEIHLPLSASQQTAIDDVDRAITKLRTGDADTQKWARVLAPNAFEGKPEEQWPEIAEAVKKANGTFGDSRREQIINAHPGENAKVSKAVELAKQYVKAGKPMVIFAHRLQSVQQLHAELAKAGLKVASMTGADSSAAKGIKAAQFQGAPGVAPSADVIVLSDAAATGLNLQRGKALIHLDQPMTFMCHQQRSARINRLGQTEDVDIINLLADHDYDKRARARVKRKEELADIYQSPVGYVDDTGLAESLSTTRKKRMQGFVDHEEQVA
jgi:hypothetical protein